MSISRKNWSALSSLARQWTQEDEEEVEREKRRRGKSTSGADPDSDDSPAPKGAPGGDSSTSDTSQGLSSAEQIQLDFVEMLRTRDERRRMRHVETLRRQKEAEEGSSVASREGGAARVELLGDLDDDQTSSVPSSVNITSKPKPGLKPATTPKNTSAEASVASPNRQRDKDSSSGKDPDPKPSSNPARKFVSSVSISLDKGSSGCSSPMSPRSPSGALSPRDWTSSECQSPSPDGARSPVQNGHGQETSVNGSPSSGCFQQAPKAAFVRQSSRTASFRMMRRKEQESSPLQRSASARMTSKKFENNTEPNEEENEDKASSFQRNSKQRISSRTIQEKMERLAQAAQKSEVTRSPDVTQRTLFLLDEVTRKRGLFEKEQPGAAPTSPGVSRQEFRSFASGMSDRINRWLNKTNQTGPSHSPADLRHVDIKTKRSLFESSGGDNEPKSIPGKIYK